MPGKKAPSAGGRAYVGFWFHCSPNPYHNQFWISHNPDGAYEALGVHGQMIHINPTVGLVVVRLSSHPVASTGFTFPHTRPALEALANLLRTEKPSHFYSYD